MYIQTSVLNQREGHFLMDRVTINCFWLYTCREREKREGYVERKQAKRLPRFTYYISTPHGRFIAEKFSSVLEKVN